MNDTNFKALNIAVIIPCHNEELTISKVINDFRTSLPHSIIYVFDNVSTDDTSAVALSAGAIVHKIPNKGKGNVMRRMFADIEADIYVMVDGDDTYDASRCPEMICSLTKENLDLVVAIRDAQNTNNAYRRGHVFGNFMLSKTVSFLFGYGFTDMLSGYRVMSRRFVKSFPVVSSGFEIETEMTVHALQIGASYCEIETFYDSRPDGSESKLNTYQDGIRILWMIFLLFKEVKPFQFFGIFSLLFSSISIFLFIPILFDFIDTGLVPRLPTAILSTGLMILAFLSLVSGVILDSLSHARLEAKRMFYLSNDVRIVSDSNKVK